MDLNGGPEDNYVTAAEGAVFDQVDRGSPNLVNGLSGSSEQHISVSQRPIVGRACLSDVRSGVPDEESVVRIQVPVTDARNPYLGLVLLGAATTLEERTHAPEPQEFPLLGDVA